MKTCPQFLQGNCRFGDRCRFAHLAKQQQHGGRGGRHQPYPKGGKNAGFERPIDDGDAHGPQRRNARQQQQQQQQQQSRNARGPQQQQQQQQGHPDLRQQQQLQRNSPGGAGAATPLSPADNYPQPPREDPALQQQAQQQQPQRPQQQPAMMALHRARAMCKLLGIGNPAPLVTPETEATAVKFFAQGSYFRETPFADSIEKFLPPLKQQ